MHCFSRVRVIYAFFLVDYLWVDWVWRKRAVPRDVLQPGQQQKVLESRQQVHGYWPPASTISNQLHNGWWRARPKDGCNGEWRLHHKYVSKFTLGVTRSQNWDPCLSNFPASRGGQLLPLGYTGMFPWQSEASADIRDLIYKGKKGGLVAFFRSCVVKISPTEFLLMGGNYGLSPVEVEGRSGHNLFF